MQGIGSVAPFVMPIVGVAVDALVGISSVVFLTGMSKAGMTDLLKPRFKRSPEEPPSVMTAAAKEPPSIMTAPEVEVTPSITRSAFPGAKESNPVTDEKKGMDFLLRKPVSEPSPSISPGAGASKFFEKETAPSLERILPEQKKTNQGSRKLNLI
ncbi:MAG: hypothetical protein V1721_06745 [Pseudomonadota bacterium]